ncbi:hypothetical protein [Streptomyces albus]|uniref:hypothetical protein n=1 Tax=Streptomyces albus TaxID=1888 RepID=UPI0033F76D9A
MATNPTTPLTTARTYLLDLVERVLATFLVAAAGIAVAAGPADMFSASFWQTVGAAGIAAVASLVKGLVAKAVGNPESASAAPRV